MSSCRLRVGIPTRRLCFICFKILSSKFFFNLFSFASYMYHTIFQYFDYIANDLSLLTIFRRVTQLGGLKIEYVRSKILTEHFLSDLSLRLY